MAEYLWLSLNSGAVTNLLLYPSSDGRSCEGPPISYSVFSGNTDHRNDPASTHLANVGPLPRGRYYVVDRPSGGRLGWLWDAVGGKGDWFALYRDDGAIDDTTMVGGVRRGQFRMHAGSRSAGCVTFTRQSEYDDLRRRLLATPTEQVALSGGGSLSYYAILTVE